MELYYVDSSNNSIGESYDFTEAHSMPVYGYEYTSEGLFYYVKTGWANPDDQQKMVLIKPLNNFFGGMMYLDYTGEHVYSNRYEYIHDSCSSYICTCSNIGQTFTYLGPHPSNTNKDQLKCNSCNTTLPYQFSHLFFNHSYDSSFHREVCLLCGRYGNISTHTIQYNHKKDCITHHADCIYCDYEYFEDHEWENNVCTICDLLRSRANHEILYVGNLQSHYGECFTPDCGYVTSSCSGHYTLTYNDTKHIHTCTCGYVNYANHIIVWNNETHEHTCSVCDYNGGETHAYVITGRTSTYHTYYCVCGHTYNETHTFVSGGLGRMRCSVCGYTTTGPVVHD